MAFNDDTQLVGWMGNDHGNGNYGNDRSVALTDRLQVKLKESKGGHKSLSKREKKRNNKKPLNSGVLQVVSILPKKGKKNHFNLVAIWGSECRKEVSLSL